LAPLGPQDITPPFLHQKFGSSLLLPFHDPLLRSDSPSHIDFPSPPQFLPLWWHLYDSPQRSHNPWETHREWKQWQKINFEC
jgi:hypothetical protein